MGPAQPDWYTGAGSCRACAGSRRERGSRCATRATLFHSTGAKVGSLQLFAEVGVPTKEQVLAALGDGTDYDEAARRLGIHPGLAYLIATGLPADGSDVLTEEENRRPRRRRR